MLPLALGIAGAMVKYMRSEEMSHQSKSIFSTIHASVDILPRTVQEQLLLMAVLATGVTASSEMLASLWDVVRNYQYLSAWYIGLYTSPRGLVLSIIGVVLSLITRAFLGGFPAVFLLR